MDSLIVRLGLDSSQFKSESKKVDEGFKSMAKEAAAFLALVGGTVAIKSFVSDIIVANAQLGIFAQNLGLSVSEVSAFDNAAEVAGGSAAGLSGTLDMLSKSQTQLMITGQSALIPYFSALGVSIADVGGKAKQPTELLLQLSSKFAGMNRTTAFNMGRMMGIDEGTMNLLLRGRHEVEIMIARQKEFGVVTKDQAEQSQKFRARLVESRQEFEAFGRTLVSDMLPALNKLLDMFDGLGKWMREHKQFVEAFLISIAVGLAAIAIVTLPINATAIAILAIGAALSALYDDYQTWKKGGQSLFDWTTFDKLAKSTDGWRGVIVALTAAFVSLAAARLKANAADVASDVLGASKGGGGKFANLGKLLSVLSAAEAGWEIGGAINSLVDYASGGQSSIGSKIYDWTHPVSQNNRSNTSSTETNISNMNIYTQATDAAGILNEMDQSINQNTALAAHSNSGTW